MLNLDRIIQELLQERERINGIIRSLESMTGGGPAIAPKRRGRKSMDKDAREEVSLRMKNYWAGRRSKGPRADSFVEAVATASNAPVERGSGSDMARGAAA